MVTAKVPYFEGIDGLRIDKRQYESGLSELKNLVYERRDGMTCEDFQLGATKVLKYEEFSCALIHENNFNADAVCYFGGHKIDRLPLRVAKALSNQLAVTVPLP